MKRLLLVVFATLLVAPVGLAYASFLSKSIDFKTEASMLIVREVPEDFAPQAIAMGFSKIERLDLYGVSKRTFRIAIPAGHGIGSSIDILRGAFPDAFVDMDGWVN